MKDWWLNLSLQEKQTITLGGIVGILLLLYLFVWSPLNDKVEALRKQIHEDRGLLTWMQQADEHIEELTKTSQSKPSAILGSALSTVQAQVNQSPLGKHVTQLRQAESDAVQINFQKVGFDGLVTWLTQLGKKYGLIVTQASIKPSDGEGMVVADILIK